MAGTATIWIHNFEEIIQKSVFMWIDRPNR